MPTKNSNRILNFIHGTMDIPHKRYKSKYTAEKLPALN